MAIKCCVAIHHWYEMSLDMKDPHATRKQYSLRRQLPQNPVPISNAHSTKLLQAVFRFGHVVIEYNGHRLLESTTWDHHICPNYRISRVRKYNGY